MSFGKEQWPYGDKQLVLLTSRSTENLPDRISVASSVDEVLAILRQKGYRDVWVVSYTMATDCLDSSRPVSITFLLGNDTNKIVRTEGQLFLHSYSMS